MALNHAIVRACRWLQVSQWRLALRTLSCYDKNLRGPFSTFRFRGQNFLYALVVRVFPRRPPPGLVHSDTFFCQQDHEVYVYDAEAKDVVKPPPNSVCTMGASLGDIVTYPAGLHKRKY